ncbi:hypothetical protein BH24ACI3_BH24ACI3_04390 [soil metagenome]
MHEINDFFNDGFGWRCRHCVKAAQAVTPDTGRRSRIMTEGEAESKDPQLSTKGLAKWADPAHRYLICPNCGIRELVDPK